MSRRLTALLLALLVLVGAMGLKTAVMAHSNSAIVMANGPAPFPPSLMNGPAPFPPSANGPAPFPPAASVSSR
jgi:hypothetical protein